MPCNIITWPILKKGNNQPINWSQMKEAPYLILFQTNQCQHPAVYTALEKLGSKASQQSCMVMGQIFSWNGDLQESVVFQVQTVSA